MASVHLADEERRLHPIYSCCATIMASSEGREALTELMLPRHRILHHVAMYVVTTAGQALVRRKRKSQKRKSGSITAFGGCSHPNNVLRMLNSLRLELMDEASMILKHTNMAACSPLCILDDVLLQVVLVSQSWVDQAALWCPESVREKHGDLPQDIGEVDVLPEWLDTRPLRI